VLAPRRVVHGSRRRRARLRGAGRAGLGRPPGPAARRARAGETIGVIGVSARSARSPLVLAACSRRRGRRLRRSARRSSSSPGGSGADETVDLSERPRRNEGELDLVVETAGAVPADRARTRLPRMGGRVVALGDRRAARAS
jgi:hypothetical protein